VLSISAEDEIDSSCRRSECNARDIAPDEQFGATDPV
jgi:hypothetical protein